MQIPGSALRPKALHTNVGVKFSISCFAAVHGVPDHQTQHTATTWFCEECAAQVQRAATTRFAEVLDDQMQHSAGQWFCEKRRPTNIHKVLREVLADQAQHTAATRFCNALAEQMQTLQPHGFGRSAGRPNATNCNDVVLRAVLATQTQHIAATWFCEDS